MNVLYSEFNETHPGQVDILAIPTNQFGLQEPGDNDEILKGLKYVRPGKGYVPFFKLTEKCEANGKTAHPFFVWLKKLCPSPTRVIGDASELFYKPIANDDITWNFEKFLIDPHGKPYKRYAPADEPEVMRQDIEFLLNFYKETQEISQIEEQNRNLNRRRSILSDLV